MMQVNVKVSALLDRLIFESIEKGGEGIVRRELAKYNSGIRLNRAPEGIWVASIDVGRLNLGEVELDFKWTELAERFVQNRRRLTGQMSHLITEIKSIRQGGKKAAITYLNKDAGLEILDDHQWVNVACMTLPDSYGLCVFDEQGAGKTVTLIFAFDILVERDEVDFALIIAPKSMISEWPVDFKKFMNGRYRIQTLTGNRTQKIKDLSENLDVIVTNFETVVAMEDELRALLRKHGTRSILVVDESFFAKNLDSKRTQSILRLREYCGRAFVLCGTPAPNSAIDLVQQFNIVDFGSTFGGIALPNEKEEAAKVIHEIIEERGPFVRHLKSNVLPNLPAKRFQIVNISMGPKQASLYKDTLDDLVDELKGIDDDMFEKRKMSFFAKRNALLQICSNPRAVSDQYEETPAKILALDNILENLIEKRKEKVIVWSFYTASIQTIFTRYLRYQPVRYDGTVSEISERREAVRRFREDGDTKLFVGNPAAAGAGLNLQSARYAVYESMSNQAAHYLQSLDRIHRRGQEREVEYLILLCEGTIEIPEYNRLIQKEQAAQAMLGDIIIPALTRETMLSELLL